MKRLLLCIHSRSGSGRCGGKCCTFRPACGCLLLCPSLLLLRLLLRCGLLPCSRIGFFALEFLMHLLAELLAGGAFRLTLPDGSAGGHCHSGIFYATHRLAAQSGSGAACGLAGAEDGHGARPTEEESPASMPKMRSTRFGPSITA